MFKEKVTRRKCFLKEANESIFKLETTLVKECATIETNSLENCIMDMFGETEELENT